jgi:hypothetical protein
VSHTRAQLRRTGRIGLIVSALGLAIAIAVANPALATGSATSAQPISKADANLGGANGQCPGGPYCSTRDGSPSMNGNGKGAAIGKPAGAVGKADNKNPPGQMPNGSDHNKGYECDGNHGIGRSNPAHTGCTPPVVNPPAVNPPAVNPPAVNPPAVNPPAVNPPAVNPPAVNPPAVNPPAVNPPVSGQPQILRELFAPKAASQFTHPLPVSAAAGEADTSGQLVAAGFAAFAAFLALGSGVVLRRRHGDA